MSELIDPKLVRQVVNTIKFLAVDAVQKANSGHPGMPMGAADMAFVVWSRFLRYDPTAPDWPDRDRFVLSAGHGCMLLYSLLHLAGYELPLSELRAFRQWGSRTPGPSRVRPHRGRRGDHGAAGAGGGQRGGHGPGGPHAGRARQRAGRLRPGQPPRLRPGQRRRPDGGGQRRGRVAGRPPRAGQPDRALRQQPDHHRGQHRPDLVGGRRAGATRPTAGTCSGWTATTTRRSARRSRRRPPRRSGRR